MRYINSMFTKEQFSSFFEELRLELYFRVEYIRQSSREKEKYDKVYKQLPITKIYRQHKRMVVKLRVPELTERYDKMFHFNSAYDKNSKLSPIPERYKDLADADLAKMIIERYLEAGRLVIHKMIVQDNFDYKRYEQILLKIKDSISDEFLQRMNIEQEADRKREYIENALTMRECRRKSNKQKNTLVKEICIYTFALLTMEKPPYVEIGKVLGGKSLSFNHPSEVLEPFAYRYERKFCKVLRHKKLLCPDYKSLTIFAATNEDDALIAAAWGGGAGHCGIATFDYEKYKTLSGIKKERVVFDIICQGLRDYVKLDKLDSTIVEDAIKEVESAGTSTELSLLDTRDIKQIG